MQSRVVVVLIVLSLLVGVTGALAFARKPSATDALAPAVAAEIAASRMMTVTDLQETGDGIWRIEMKERAAAVQARAEQARVARVEQARVAYERCTTFFAASPSYCAALRTTTQAECAQPLLLPGTAKARACERAFPESGAPAATEPKTGCAVVDVRGYQKGGDAGYASVLPCASG